MKKVISLSLVILATLALIYVAASDVPQLDTNNLTLDKAVEYALSSNSQILINEGGINAAKVSLEEMKTAQSSARQNKAARGDYEVEKTVQGYYVRLAQMGVTISEKTLEKSREQLKAKVQVDYFTFASALAAQENADRSYTLAEQTLNIVRERLSLGLVSELEVMQIETAFEKAKADKSAAQRASRAAERTLSQTLNLPLDTKITLSDDISMLPLPAATAEEKLGNAVLNRMECIAAREQAAVDKLEFEIMVPWYDERTHKYKKAEIQVQESNLNVYRTEEQAKMLVYKAYDDMLNAYEMLPVVRMAKEQTQKLYDVAIIKYEGGMATATEVLDALTNLENAQIAYDRAILGYNLSVITFENSYGIGI